jgi:hypothetical protein
VFVRKPEERIKKHTIPDAFLAQAFDLYSVGRSLEDIVRHLNKDFVSKKKVYTTDVIKADVISYLDQEIKKLEIAQTASFMVEKIMDKFPLS